MVEAQLKGMDGIDEESHASARGRKLDCLVLGEEGRVAERLIDIA
jgi:hypothetical protein